jgi:hypothetical protein
MDNIVELSVTLSFILKTSKGDMRKEAVILNGRVVGYVYYDEEGHFTPLCLNS